MIEKKVICFMRPTCPYCRYTIPLFTQVEKAFEGQGIDFQTVDISSDAQYYKNKYNFRTVPSVIYFKDGKELFRHGSNNMWLSFNEMMSYVHEYLEELPD